MPEMNQFFQDAGAEQLQGDPQMQDELTLMLAQIEAQRNKLTQLMQVASQMGEDVTILQPLVERMAQAQMQMMQQARQKTLVPTAAGQPQQANVPAPGLPQMMR